MSSSRSAIASLSCKESDMPALRDSAVRVSAAPAKLQGGILTLALSAISQCRVVKGDAPGVCDVRAERTHRTGGGR